MVYCWCTIVWETKMVQIKESYKCIEQVMVEDHTHSVKHMAIELDLTCCSLHYMVKKLRFDVYQQQLLQVLMEDNYDRGYRYKFLKRNDETQFTILSNNWRPFLGRWDPFPGLTFLPTYIQWNYIRRTPTTLNPNFVLGLIFPVFTCKLYRSSSHVHLHSRKIALWSF